MSLVESISSLPTAFIKTLTGSNEIAPLFVAPCVETEETEDIVELACGHTLRTKHVGKTKSARTWLIGSVANLSIFEATRCPFCESGLLANRDVGSERGSGATPMYVAVKQTTSDKERVLCGLERKSNADEQNQEERGDRMLVEPSADERPDMSFGETLLGACRRAKKALSIKGASGSRLGFEGA